MAIPSSRPALIKTGSNKVEIKELPVQQVRPGHLLVQVKAVALNPVDEQMLEDPDRHTGTAIGVDFSGIVVDIGNDPAVASRFKVNDRVASGTISGHPGYPELGAFTTYILARADFCIHLPPTVTFEDGSTLGAGLISSNQGLYRSLQLALPPISDLPLAEADRSHNPWILIYAGATATGSIAIQLAKVSGLRVVTTCSPKNFDLVKARGADVVFDYHDPNVASLIRTATSDSLALIFDCIGNKSSRAICVASLPPAESSKSSHSVPRYTTLEYIGPDPSRPDVVPDFLLGYLVFGISFGLFGDKTPEPDPRDGITAAHTVRVVEELLSKGRFLTIPIELGEGGLEGILKVGLERVRSKSLRGAKLVYTI